MDFIYDDLVRTMGDPTKPPVVKEPTKRDKHRAGQLTGKVWAEVCRGVQQNAEQPASA